MISAISRLQLTRERIENKIDPPAQEESLMAEPAEQPDPVDKAAQLEAAVGQAIQACGGDPVAALRSLLVMNGMLEQELRDVYAKASRGYLRGRRVSPAQGTLPLGDERSGG